MRPMTIKMQCPYDGDTIERIVDDDAVLPIFFKCPKCNKTIIIHSVTESRFINTNK